MVYRINGEGNAEIFEDSGEVATRIISSKPKAIFPVDSDLGVGYEHPKGIILTEKDAKYLGIEEE